MISEFDILARLVVAACIGGLVGLEREVVHKPAGIRTHMLVSLGSAILVMIASQAAPDEVARVIAGIATGIGFLGAGTIFKAKADVHGLTTAASIWVVAGVGIAVGLGFYFIATVSAVFMLIILHMVKIDFVKKL